MTTLKATDLKLAIDKVNKAIFIDKGIIVSNYIFIEAKEKRLRIHITNIDNHFETFLPIEGEDFQVILSADLFIKYINKLNDTKDIIFEKTESGLKISQGNSRAEFAMSDITEEDFLLFNEIEKPSESELIKVDYEDLKNVMNYLPSAVDNNMYNPEYTCFVIGKDLAVSTNSYKLCGLKIDLFKTETTYLLTHKLVKYMQGLTETGDLYFGVNADGIHLINDKVHILGLPYESDRTEKLMSAVRVLLSSNFENKIIIDKTLLADALDRLSIFINLETKTYAKMVVKNDSFILYNVKGTGKEIIPITLEEGVENIENWTWHVDIRYFKALFDSLNGDKIVLSYSKDSNTIGLSDGVCNQILALSIVE